MTVAEYAPNLVKKTVVGAGHGEKAQIRMMIGVLLPKADPQSEDAADALAIAICHAHHRTQRAVEGGGAMIGKLKGIVDSYGEDYIILDVTASAIRCIARRARCRRCRRRASRRRCRSRPMCARTRSSCSALRSDVEREWFRLLQTVQGVGAKVALSVLGTLKVSELASAIAMRDKATVSRSPGVGQKVAERIVTELKDKVPAFADIDPAVVHLAGALDEKRAPRPVMDAVSALVNLGYGQPQAAAAIAAARAARARAPTPPTLIRQGLKELAQMSITPRRLIAAEKRDDDVDASLRPQRLQRIHRPGEGARQSSRVHRGRARRARKRSTTCCSSARRASARPRWRRSSRANWA